MRQPEIINGAWIGSNLSNLERLSISSFLYHGHPYHLYTYNDIRHIPKGTVIRDANEIMPRSKLETYRKKVIFSDYFRFALLAKKGGWWCDLDVVCLRPFVFPDECIAGGERGEVNTAVIKLTRVAAQDVHDRMKQINYGEEAVGPKVMSPILRPLVTLYDDCFFYPQTLDWGAWLISKNSADLSKSYSAHLYGGLLEQNGLTQSKNARFDPNCLFERWKSIFMSHQFPFVRPKKHYSQCNQDRVLDEIIFKEKDKGVFVDVGAFKTQYSNTKFFEEERNWSGICIEPHPSHAKILRRTRKVPVEEVAISTQKGMAEFMAIDGHSAALSGMERNYHQLHLERIGREIKQEGGNINRIQVVTMPMNILLEKYNLNDIDYCSIDVEGGELDVLQSINFKKTKIKCFTIENQYEKNIIRTFMQSVGYKLWGVLGNDDVFLSSE